MPQGIRIAFLILAGCALPALAGYWSLASFGHSFLAATFTLSAGIPIFAAGLVTWLAGRFRKSRPTQRTGMAISLWSLAAVALVWCSLGLGSIFQLGAIGKAQSYPNRLAPVLEEHRRMHGAYPDSLEDLAKAPPLPRLLGDRYAYQSRASNYRLVFRPPSEMLGVWIYESATGHWEFSR